MQYRRMGRTGLKVSEFCLGTMTFGHGTSEHDAERIVREALDAGVNFFDTANAYSDGQSEIMLGKALQGHRDQAVVATKFFNPMGTGPNDSGMSRRHIMRAIDDSLKRLRMEYVDLYYIHHVDVQTPIEEALRAIDDLIHQGKVCYAACSNYPAWRLSEALWTSERHGLHRIECYQPQYSLVVRDIEQEILPLCRHTDLGVVCWGPLAGGFLSGKYAPGSRRLEGTRSAEGWVFSESWFAASADQTLETVLRIARELGRSPAQVALRWVLDRPGITAAIAGARTIEQWRDNLGCVGWSLPEEAMRELTAVSALPDRYPESIEKSMHLRRDNAVRSPTR
ncbi:MAG: aldo/keto reductase [Planctomycetaceae bacterium]